MKDWKRKKMNMPQKGKNEAKNMEKPNIYKNGLK